MAVDTTNGRKAVRSGDQHTGPQPTHETITDKMQQDDLAAREAALAKARDQHVGKTAGMKMPNDAS